MALTHQKDLFDIPEEITYLNIAALSPSTKSIEKAGMDAVRQKSRPYTIPSSDFFEPVTELKSLFAQLIHCEEPERIATIPSVSYGMATVANNITLQDGDEILVLQEQFPSNIYAWKKLAEKFNAKLVTVKMPESKHERGHLWNHAVLEAINERTAVVAMGHIHWSNGTLFDLKKIRAKTKQLDSLLIIDGSQTIGAFPFSVAEIQPDALICAGYKWLFGPYGCAYAYYGPYFDEGNPIEDNWANRKDSHKLVSLTDYQSEYKPLANRYVVGESGNFIYVKMQIEALKQVIDWTPARIQAYCRHISLNAAHKLQELGCHIEHPDHRTHHLFGVELHDSIDLQTLRNALQERQIHVSFRGDFLRLSCHLYNTEADFDNLVDCIKSLK